MKYDIKWLLNRIEKEEKVKYIFFWGNLPAKNGLITANCFSQWWNSPFVVDNIIYKTSEHWMMAQKALLFEDSFTFEKIIASKSPGEAKELGRQVNNFSPSIWEEKRFDIVLTGSLHKFGQHEDLRKFLCNTKERILVEASPVDNIWGIGLSSDHVNAEKPDLWNGLNLLGFALMETRDFFQVQMNNN